MIQAHDMTYEELIEKIVKMGINKDEQEFRIIVYE
jgi:hypothetical protein